MRIRTCFRCRLSAGCEIKKEKLKSVRGLGLTLIDFKCEAKRDNLKAGMVCIAKLQFTWDGETVDEDVFGAGYGGELPAIEPGELRVVVRRWSKPSKVLVTAVPGQPRTMVKQDGTPIMNASLFPDLLTPTGDTLPVTECCQWPTGEQGWEMPSEIHCHTCNPIYHEEPF